MTVSYENHTFSNAIYAGALADDLLRPHPVVLIPLGENLAIRAWHAILAVPLFLVVAFFVPLNLTWPALLMALPALLLAAALRFLFTYLLALSAFWTERAHAIVGLGETLIFLLGGEAAPVALLPPALRAWGEALPFRAMHAFPAEVAVGSLAPPQILAGFGWQFVWLAVFSGLVMLAWRAGIRRFTAVGG
jgi:ABC-2 type transport system permease protein